MHFATTLAVMGFATLCSSHAIMNTPVPFGKSSLTNSPLLGDGSDFPCKQRAGVYSVEGASNSMALGSIQPLSFTGSAVHGGGSCQISITYDAAPTKNSVWKVIHSIEGGCPMRDIAGNNGNDASQISPSKYSFQVPDNLPTGDAVLAWTWFNKVGNREMYMNCAPITIGGTAAGKRSDDDALTARNATQLMERDTAAYNALPDMFTANIGNGCGTADNMNVLFPSPGSSVEKNSLVTEGDSKNAVPPTGTCATAAGGDSGSPEASNVASSAAPEATSASTAASIPGGVFITVSSAAGSQPTATPVPVSSEAPVASETSSIVPAPSSVDSASPPVGTGTTGSGSVQTGACSTEGEWNCIGGTSFQQCASGTWSVVQQVAAGTICTAGQSGVINIAAVPAAKREIRFSNAHVRRHLQKRTF